MMHKVQNCYILILQCALKSEQCVPFLDWTPWREEKLSVIRWELMYTNMSMRSVGSSKSEELLSKSSQQSYCTERVHRLQSALICSQHKQNLSKFGVNNWICALMDVGRTAAPECRWQLNFTERKECVVAMILVKYFVFLSALHLSFFFSPTTVHSVMFFSCEKSQLFLFGLMCQNNSVHHATNINSLLLKGMLPFIYLYLFYNLNLIFS